MESNERFLSVEIDIPAPWLSSNLGQKIFIFKIRMILVAFENNIQSFTLLSEY